MHHVIFEQADSYDIAILIKTVALKKDKMEQHYVKPLVKRGIDATRMIGFSLEYDANNKCKVATGRAYLSVLMKALDNVGVKTIYVCDSIYFKLLTGEKKVEPHYGYMLPCAIKEFEHMNVVVGSNYQGLFYNPDLQGKMDLSIDALANNLKGTHVELGSDMIHSESYPKGLSAITEALNQLHKYPSLVCDLEAFSLKFWKAGIGTCGFAWDKHNGIAFACDYQAYIMPKIIDGATHYGKQINNLEVKHVLFKFLCKYKGKLTYHNANYDIKILVYELFMHGLLDQKGMIEGIQCLTKNFDDTKLIVYLATNSCAGNTLGLKPNAHEYAGNYAEEDIKDIRKIPYKNLLKYNLIDCLCTHFVKEKFYQQMVNDNQLGIYNTIFLPSVKVILQTELTGMPLDWQRVHEVKSELEIIENTFLSALFTSPIIIDYIKVLRQKKSDEMHAEWKTKTAPIEDFANPDNKNIYTTFNPGSNPQVQKLMYDVLGYDVIDLTKSKMPAVGAKTLTKLKHVAKSQDHADMLDDLIGLTKVSKILSTFITAFLENSVQKEDGVHYLHGSFNIGGTVSGRLSASNPNLQTIPSGSTYAKLIKSCFVAPEGWIMVGCDFASLEDRISALTTKDKNKLKVYTDKYDGHCLRAFSYFGDQMPDIIDTVESINSIADRYDFLRSESKAPTFLLTYGGTYHGMISNLGWSKEKSQDIENRYHTLYVESDKWVADKLIQATKDGYITTAFDLRVRTPILKQSLLNTSSTTFEAAAEGRTAGNALGQGYCMLNNRAAIEFQELTLNSQYWNDVRPIAPIHDAQYFLVRENIDTLTWFNRELVRCMQWQELPELQHSVVKLGGDLEVYFPSWANKTSIPNGANQDEILSLLEEFR